MNAKLWVSSTILILVAVSIAAALGVFSGGRFGWEVSAEWQRPAIVSAFEAGDVAYVEETDHLGRKWVLSRNSVPSDVRDAINQQVERNLEEIRQESSDASGQ